MTKVITLPLVKSFFSAEQTMDSRARQPLYDRLAAAITIAFVIVATFYSVATPAFEASDELYHYPFIKHLADGKGLPVLQDSSGGTLYFQEGGQPPLYYLVSAAATFWINTGTESEIYQRNPHASIGEPLRADNKNMVIHTDSENFPYSGVFLALHMIRFLSVLMSAGTVYLTYLVGMELFPGEPRVALAAAVFNAFLPQVLFISGSVNNDNLITLLSSGALLLTIKAAKGKISLPGIAILSILVGMAALTKLSGLALLPLVSLVATIDCVRKRRPAEFVRIAFPVWIAWLAISGWWYVRNWLLYGDPLGLSAFLKIVGERWPKPSFLEILINEAEGLRLSFWGVFGGFNVLASPSVYLVLDGLGILSIVGLVLYVVRSQVRSRFRAFPYAVALGLLWIIVILVSLLRWTQLTTASQGRLLFPAISIISVLFALGICALVPRKFGTHTVGALSAAMIVLSVSVPLVSIVPTYARPELRLGETGLSYERSLQISFSDKVKLLGMDLPSDRIEEGQDLAVTLYLSSSSQMDKDYSLFIHVLDAEGVTVGKIDSYPGRGALPTRLWPPGYVVKDSYTIPISTPRRTAEVLRVEAGFYDVHDMVPLRAFDQTGKSLGTSPIVARIKLARHNPTITPSPNFLGKLEDEVGLLGYSIDNQDLSPGSVLKGTLEWQALKRLDRDYTVFVQLVGGNGLISQYDSYPQKGAYPTSFWDVGEIVDDRFDLELRANTPDGSYDLIVGMYDLASEHRLAAGSETFLKLQTIRVKGN